MEMLNVSKERDTNGASRNHNVLLVCNNERMKTGFGESQEQLLHKTLYW